MSRSHTELDQHLRVLFGGLDTGADFDTRLMARLRAESQGDATGRALRARQQERARHRRAVAALESRGRSMLQQLTLDTLGIVLLVVLAAVAAWPHIGASVVEIWRRQGAYVLIALGFVIAAIPLLGMWAEQVRRPLRLT